MQKNLPTNIHGYFHFDNNKNPWIYPWVYPWIFCLWLRVKNIHIYYPKIIYKKISMDITQKKKNIKNKSIGREVGGKSVLGSSCSTWWRYYYLLFYLKNICWFYLYIIILSVYFSDISFDENIIIYYFIIYYFGRSSHHPMSTLDG
jgi:hypothetical protein